MILEFVDFKNYKETIKIKKEILGKNLQKYLL